jgi:hypothetical protein
VSSGRSRSVRRLPRRTPPACSVSPRRRGGAPGLLRLRNRNGRPVYPVIQFAGPAQLLGVAEVVTALTPALLPLTIAAWSTGASAPLDEALRFRAGCVDTPH